MPVREYMCSACNSVQERYMKRWDAPPPPCPQCGAQLGPQDFQQGETATVIGQTGTKKKPNGLPKWSVFSPLQIDTDPTKDFLEDVPLLALEWEVDASDVRATFPGFVYQLGNFVAAGNATIQSMIADKMDHNYSVALAVVPLVGAIVIAVLIGMGNEARDIKMGGESASAV